MLGLVVLLVVLESFWQLQQVQALVHVFVGVRVNELTGVGLDELVLSGDSGAQVSLEEPRYTLPIATISHPIPATPTSTSVEETCALETPHTASYKKIASLTVDPEATSDPPDQNN